MRDAELAEFSRLVHAFSELPADDPSRLRAERVAESFAREGRRQRRQARRDEVREADAALRARTATGATARREDAPLAAPSGDEPAGELRKPRRCYVCKRSYQQLDAFYHLLCSACAADNAARRGLTTDLRGRRALLTGGRVKIGFQLSLMLLRDGAELIVTSRFPRDAVRRFQAVPDSAAWLDRLTVVGIDLRDPRQVLGLCDELRASGGPLDILVNNAAQTLRRPPESYARLAAGEREALPAGRRAGVRYAPGFAPTLALSPVWPAAELEAAGGPGRVLDAPVDEAGLLPDTAPENSWSARLGGLDPAEVLETQLVNSLAPALLCDRLLPLLLASPYPRRYIVNVTAVEGRFAVRLKTGGHPHTNMAKAALNMLTRTSAAELATHGVHMCAVDTGWITDENPAPKKARIAERGFRTPLDVVDGAARIYDPIVRGEAGCPVSGVFLKDYQEAAW
ncbi:SDR family NAD(P)-dependent oxidoreductase [Streptomyces sp. DSM 44915]|uniref:SDR family NAD(P)-dependent oxidoreductase n=1 Tax=Streptomyces chisholmiae TaxID=3075540 RepID=A0ABU2JV31_9ACTN|nr:SDR family NAD(P)-dependent oxidoreductase [Streptomyces sp. DSM 44915]MDT0268611.1 SDR family NAD(P)-dependent oxidoreductase [Streptomyces sp. DSM 44915]